MGFHTFPVERADALEDVSRYRHLSIEELVALLDPDGTELVVDLGSGSGFYTDDVARFVDRVLAVDLQPAMSEIYRRKGTPDNVDPVTAAADRLPFRDDALDAAFTTMTYHELQSHDALVEIHRVLRPGGRFAIADWTRNGRGEEGPSVEERYDLATAERQLSKAGFSIEYGSERPETFVVVGTVE